QDAAKAQPGTTIGGMSAQSLKEDDAKQFIANRSGENEGRILSTSQRESLDNVREQLPESNQKGTLEKALQTADKDSLPVKIAGGVQSII
ncbi:hypothetical protein FPK83_24940, partial [Acinetobacter baumannii]|nr:hypothetical protein [Acinetobacter baumannii]